MINTLLLLVLVCHCSGSLHCRVTRIQCEWLCQILWQKRGEVWACVSVCVCECATKQESNARKMKETMVERRKKKNMCVLLLYTLTHTRRERHKCVRVDDDDATSLWHVTKVKVDRVSILFYMIIIFCCRRHPPPSLPSQLLLLLAHSDVTMWLAQAENVLYFAQRFSLHSVSPLYRSRPFIYVSFIWIPTIWMGVRNNTNANVRFSLDASTRVRRE